MNSDLAFWIQLVTTMGVGVILWNFIRFQGDKIEKLNQLLNAQKAIIEDYDRRRSLFSSESVEDVVKLSVHHKELQLLKSFQETTESIEKTAKDALDSVNERHSKTISEYREGVAVTLPMIIVFFAIGLSTTEDPLERERLLKNRLPNSWVLYKESIDEIIASMKGFDRSQMVAVIRKMVINTAQSGGDFSGQL